MEKHQTKATIVPLQVCHRSWSNIVTVRDEAYF